MEPVNQQNLAIYLFSFNRGQFLGNCLESIRLCASDFETTIVDDNSGDPETRSILDSQRPYWRFLEPQDTSDSDHKTGGLYNNMRLAFKDAKKRNKSYVLFIQDDMQLVRRIEPEDLAAASDFFKSNTNSAELHTCFLKRYLHERDQATMGLDSSQQAYLRPSDYPGFSGFSAVGLFSVTRFHDLFGELRRGEYANNEFAQTQNIQMGFARNPFMMWLPYPISHRGKKRNMQLHLVEGLAGCGYFPYETMTQERIKLLKNRPASELPLAENWLTCPNLSPTKYWSFAGGLSNLHARGGMRGQAGKILSSIKRNIQ